MHFVQPFSVKAAAPRAATAVVAAPHFGRQQQRPCSTESYGWRSQPNYTKLPTPMDPQRSILPGVSHIPHATKDDDAIADAQLASAAEAFMPEVWPDFSKMKVDSDIVVNGKSELIKILKEEEGPRMLHIDLRMHDTSSPALMAQQLHKQARKLPAVVGMQFLMVLASQLGPLSNLYKLFYPDSDNTGAGAAATPMEKIVEAFMADVFPKYTATNLTAVIDAYDKILDNLPPGQTKPVIVIDEANGLQLWKNGFDANSRDDQVLGDLTSKEAFVYLCGGKMLSRNGYEENWPGLIAQSAETLALGMTKEDWKKVWSVCGGNIHLLKVCVGYAEQCNSWEKVGSDGPRIWEAKHYKAVLRLIAANPYHAVRRKEVYAVLEKVGIKMVENATAAKVLLSMVEFNVLSLRPYSEMAEDIPREAFFKKAGRKEKQDKVVTMPSPTHLAAVLELDVELEEEQLEIKSAQAVEGSSEASS
ncbi:hypothetical protein KSW81_007017 [Nannochloris sp. 'desiccata']|nr:hypothetical protein KSW81_007017 [Chlorella desiccata (nom. nud.)]